MITIISGDPRLYILGIRKQKWKNFGKELLINEGQLQHNINEYDDLVTEMEGQFLLKVLKPERRVYLSTIYEKTRIYKNVSRRRVGLNQFSKESLIEILIKTPGDVVEIEDLYNRIFTRFGIANKYQSEAYSSFILKLPLRTQIQFLTEYADNSGKINEMNVIDPFLSDLIEKKVDVSVLESATKLLNVIVLKLLLNEKELGDLYQLQPTTADTSLNSSLLSLNLFSTQKISINPHLIFDYFIKIGYIRNLLTSLSYLDDENKNAITVTPSIEGLCKHAGIFQDKVLRDVLGNMTAYLKGVFPTSNTWCGIIQLLGLAGPSKERQSLINNRIDYVFKDAQKSKRILGFIPLTICATTSRNQTIPCYSIYTLIATIGEIILRTEEEDLSKGLIELSQIRTFLMPIFIRRMNEGNEESLYYPDDEETSDESIEDLVSNISMWIRNFPGFYPVSPHLLGKISTRLFYALKAIENDEDATNLGDMMHYRIISMMNAILIEDARENIGNFNKFNINNTKFADLLFLQNLKAASSQQEKLDFSKWLLSCPLFLYYLNPSEDLLSALSILIPSIRPKTVMKFTVYNELQKVAVKTNRQVRKKEFGMSGKVNYKEITNQLIEKKVPYSLFLNDIDRMTKMENTLKIKEAFKDIWENIEWDNGRISRLRNYIQNRDIKW